MNKITVKIFIGIFSVAFIGFALVTASGGLANASEAVTTVAGEGPLGPLK